MREERKGRQIEALSGQRRRNELWKLKHKHKHVAVRVPNPKMVLIGTSAVCWLVVLEVAAFKCLSVLANVCCPFSAVSAVLVQLFFALSADWSSITLIVNHWSNCIRALNAPALKHCSCKHTHTHTHKHTQQPALPVISQLPLLLLLPRTTMTGTSGQGQRSEQMCLTNPMTQCLQWL